jgi:hypothetical protein
VIDNVASLVRANSGQQKPIPFKPATWQPILSQWPTAEQVLTDDRFSTAHTDRRRSVDRDGLRALMDTTDITAPDQVLAAFTMVVVWGSGVRSRSYRNLPTALGTADCAEQLSASALACRAGDLVTAYRGMRLPGIGPAFFTKWFAFAGSGGNNKYRPLILDARVWRTLTTTLKITPSDLGYRVSPALRYLAYVKLLHQWADGLCQEGITIDAEQLEFVLFAHNGDALPTGTAV